MNAPSDFEQELSATLKRVLGHSTPSNLAESIRYSLLAPGKRIRPRLVLAAAEMLELPRPAALPAALALEMIHCFTLIHDDLPCLDNDDVRRGRPSNHKVYGEGIALLAGDALVPAAYEVFSRSVEVVPAKNFTEALQLFSEAVGPRGVIGGQAAEALLGDKSSLDDLLRMHAMKTGALFLAALEIPRALAGIASQSEKGRAIHALGEAIGAAFQILDDIDDADQDAARDPVNILRYLDREEALQQAHGDLHSAIEEVLAKWNTRAADLVRIAEELTVPS